MLGSGGSTLPWFLLIVFLHWPLVNWSFLMAFLVTSESSRPLVVLGSSKFPEIQAQLVVPDGYNHLRLQVEVWARI